MRERLTPAHPLLGELADYFAARLGPAREMEIDEHFGDCEECAGRGRQVRLAGYLVDGWTATEHARAARHASLQEGLESLSTDPQYAPWQQRLRVWLKDWTAQVEGAVQVALEGSKGGSRILAGEFAFLARPGALWSHFTPVPVGLATRGGLATATAAESAPANAPWARAELGEQGVVVVRIQGPVRGTMTPLVVLIPEGCASEAKVAELVPTQASELIARFEGLPSGTYLLVFEPQAFS